MAILRPQLNPSVGTPMPVALQARQRVRMNTPQFYQQPQIQQQQSSAMDQSTAQPSPLNAQNQAAQEPSSQDFITQQFQRYAQRPAIPQLDPGSRVTSPNMELVQPSNFQSYFNRLAAIKTTGDEMLGAAQARSAYQRMQAFNAAASAYGGPDSIGSTGAVGKSGQKYQQGSSAPSVPSNPQANFRFAQNIAGNYGWGSTAELNAWYKLGMNESGWRNNAQNPTSSAYGIGQFLNSTWGGYGIAKTSDPALQVEAMARYIKARYGSPSRALAAWNSRSPHWY